jgi:preprotein translocase subunit SecY
MFTAFINCLKIPELRQRILLTLGLLFVARVGAHIPLAGLDPAPLQKYFEYIAATGGSGALSMVNMFTGGALMSGSILSLGIMPYITASIFMQILVAVEPHLSRLSQEGDVGRQKIAQYTRYATIGIAFLQAIMVLNALADHPERIPGFSGYSVEKFGSIVLINHTWFTVTGSIIMTAGTLLLMWIGEQITQFGIGNGISLLITVNILARLPNAISRIWGMLNPNIGVEGGAGLTLDPGQCIMMLVLLVVVVAGIVMLTQGQRKIPVQYAKRVVGRRVFQGQSSYLPLKVNYSGVMPIIFASAILMFPQTIFTYLYQWFNISFFNELSQDFNRGSSWFYIAYAILIFGFSFFWVSLMFKPVQVADDLKKYGGYIPGVPPGDPTAKFLDFTMTRLTVAGAIFLTIIAVIPDTLGSIYHIDYSISQFFGGTGTLIIVGVLLDTMRQIETYLLQRHYDGFLRKGRSKNRNTTRAAQTLDRQEIRNLRPLWVPLTLLFLSGIVAWFFNTQS